MKIKHCKLSRKTQNRLLEFFVAEATARTVADLLDLNRNTVTLFYRKIRTLIAAHLEDEQAQLNSHVVDDQQPRVLHQQVLSQLMEQQARLIGIFKRGEKIYTQMLESTSVDALISHGYKKMIPDSVLSLGEYGALCVAKLKYYRMQSPACLSKQVVHMQASENFWNQAKRILSKYNGIPQSSVHLFLKECEFRFNCGSPKQQIALLKKWAY